MADGSEIIALGLRHSWKNKKLVVVPTFK